jgi:hypothetical protein
VWSAVKLACGACDWAYRELNKQQKIKAAVRFKLVGLKMDVLFHGDGQYRANIGFRLLFFHHTGKLFKNLMFRKIGCGLLRYQA